jgi:hypothetical protein
MVSPDLIANYGFYATCPHLSRGSRQPVAVSLGHIVSRRAFRAGFSSAPDISRDVRFRRGVRSRHLRPD